MNQIKITLPDGSSKEFSSGFTYYEICKSFNLLEETLAVKVRSDVISLSEEATSDEFIEFLDYRSIDGRLIYKNGLKFIFEVALKKLYQNIEVNYEHSVPNGMLADIVYSETLTKEDLDKVKNKMLELINADIVIKKLNIKKKEAIDFYNKIKDFEKATNVSNLTDRAVTLYELENRYNYFYSEMPYSTGSINKFDIIYLENNRIIFTYPQGKKNKGLPQYENSPKIIETYYDSKKWLEVHEMPYIANLNLNIGNSRIKEFIVSSETVFHSKVDLVAQEIIKNKDIKFVMIAGPSSSGKTTTTKRLAAFLTAYGYNAISISTDDYFVDRDNSPKDEDGNYDFECLEAIDLEYLNSDLRKLLKGEIITMPQYNFITGKKEPSTKNIKMKSNTIILIEGLHSLNPKLLQSIDDKNKYNIYLSPFLSVNIDRHNYISSLDVRLLRRIVRDNRSRGYGVATTIHNWQVVRNGEEKYIFPYIKNANVIINTALPYEIGILKVYVEPLLQSIGVNSVYYAEAKRLLSFLKTFFPIPGEYVDRNSILREFIGGSNV